MLQQWIRAHNNLFFSETKIIMTSFVVLDISYKIKLSAPSLFPLLLFLITIVTHQPNMPAAVGVAWTVFAITALVSDVCRWHVWIIITHTLAVPVFI